MLRGRIEVCYNNQYIELDRGDVIILSPNCGHATLALTDDATAMVLHISPEAYIPYVPNFMNYAFVLYSGKLTRQEPFYRHLRRDMARLMLQQRHGPSKGLRRLQLDRTLMNVAGAVLLKAEGVKTVKSAMRVAEERQTAFEQMITYIDEHFREKVELADMARIGGYNLSYTSQFFKRQMGLSFVEYLMRVRLREAAIRLAHEKETILAAAEASGFTDVKAFNTAFRKHFNRTPSEYRQQAQTSPVRLKTEQRAWKEFISSDDQTIMDILQVWAIEKGNYAGDAYPARADDRLKQELKARAEELLELTKSL